MKINCSSPVAAAFGLITGFIASGAILVAAPVSSPTAVHTQPSDTAPVITVLSAGSEPATTESATAPSGWSAVELPGPFQVFVQNKDFTKSLDVKPGASLYLAPKADAGVLATASKGDRSEITGIHGKWTQVRIQKKVTGYIHVGATAPAAIVAATPAPAPRPTPMAPAPVTPTAHGSAVAGQPAPSMNLGSTSAVSPSLPRSFQGKFVSTRSPFKPRRPYDWALNDDAGSRYAFLDISKLLLTEQIDSYIDHTVVVFGAPRPTPDGKDLVIEVESLQLK
jgi:hypothetical protein